MLRTLPCLLLFVTSFSYAYPRSDLPSLNFQHKDWELVCDNTRTCRAAGYHPETVPLRASILLTRRAGPNQPVAVQIQLADDDRHPSPSTLQMAIDGRPLGAVRIDPDDNTGTLSDAQVKALLPALLKDAKLGWTGNGTTWTISTAGATAVLLKMDDFQGRIDTSGALARKGSKPESSVLPALPTPVVRAAPVPSEGKPVTFTARQERELLPALRKTVHDDSCPSLSQPQRLGVHRLSNDKLLVSHPCWLAAYNTGDGYWVIDARPPYSPVLVTTSGTDYDKGVIGSVQRGRGIGDCMGWWTWTWDGRTFSQTSQRTGGMCRDIAIGGAWELPTIVTDVREAK
ncbi:DUF1176 domain-containing protein [Massilia sp. TN1-12]|uniref:DUF1176 domain-containing protein n=1 Tax=Massilia paldalensis TaxID=3377675 RepID=UPI00384F94A5